VNKVPAAVEINELVFLVGGDCRVMLYQEFLASHQWRSFSEAFLNLFVSFSVPWCWKLINLNK